jgi:hypothetical protein
VTVGLLKINVPGIGTPTINFVKPPADNGGPGTSGSGGSSGTGADGGGVSSLLPGSDFGGTSTGAEGGSGTNSGQPEPPTAVGPSAEPNFTDPSQPLGPGWVWRGSGPPGSSQGPWYNPGTDESLHPDLGHGGSIGPHYDYRAPDGQDYRAYPGGRVVPK